MISPWFYSLNKLTLVEESQSQFYSLQITAGRLHRKSCSVLWSQTIFLASDFDSIQSEDISNMFDIFSRF